MLHAIAALIGREERVELVLVSTGLIKRLQVLGDVLTLECGLFELVHNRDLLLRGFLW